MESGFHIDEVVSGTAKGIDSLGEAWAKKNKIPIKQFPANWDLHGKMAGYLRNKEMVEYADALIAITRGSKGTRLTIDLAEKKGMQMFVKEIRR